MSRRSAIYHVLLCLGLAQGLTTEATGQDKATADAQSVMISGELQQWHKVTLTVDGPMSSELATPNPFMDYRMQVRFRHQESGLTYNVPGYFAADGDAANSSATTGNKWRAHLAPDHTGKWTYQVSFRTGDGIAVSDDKDAGRALDGPDGLTGSFQIAESDKTGRDFRSKGRLKYVGKHHLQFAGTKEFFLKAGADAPENFLAYEDFDGDFKKDGHKDHLVKNWAPHVQDWTIGDPTWQNGKGKGIVGAVNYLASQGLNSFSFLTLNIKGDDENAFPYTSYDERDRIDCSRMDQWEIVFGHGTQQGMYLHFKTQEAENVNLLDNGHVGPQRKLYYRELIARFAHNLALNWNLGEEVGLYHEVSTEKKVAWANYFHEHDPYRHHIVIHNGNNHFDLLGDASALTGFSLQTSKEDFREVHGSTLRYIRRSVKAGKPWVVACDEPGDAEHSLIPDAENPDHNNARQNALWGNLMAGGAGVEWYFGYGHDHSDLSCQDYRVRQNMWGQSRTALKFFADEEIPFWDMVNHNDLLSNEAAYCLAKPDQLYLVYLKQAKETTIDLSAAKGSFDVRWFNPRAGGTLATGSKQTVNGGGKVKVGQPPADADKDWLAVIRRKDRETASIWQWETIDAVGQPSARHEAALVGFQGKVYLIGGRGVKPVDCFDPETNTWTQKSPTPLELHHFQAVVVDDAIYLMGAMTGGYPRETPFEKIVVYYPNSDTFRFADSVPESRRRGGAGAVYYQEKIYLVGGIVNGHMDGYQPWLDAYSVKTSEWEVLADAPHARDHFQAVVLHDKLYALAGRTTSAATNKVFSRTVDAVDIFDLKQRKWLPLTTKLQTPRAGNMATVWRNEVIVGGGESSRRTAHAEVEALHGSSQQWRNWPSLKRGRHGSGFAIVGDYLYTASGSGNRGGGPELTSIERLKLPNPTNR